MLKDNPTVSGQKDLFRARLDAMIDMRHALVRLSDLVDWAGLAADMAPYYCADNGRPGEPIRCSLPR